MIWKRYYLREVSLVFAFVLFLSYFLYAAIDYSTHPTAIGHSWTLLLYYFYQFSTHAEILVPIALLLATIKVLLSANTQREIIALLAAGISLKKITRPFILFGIFVMILCYLNIEYIQPKAEQCVAKEKATTSRDHVHALHLQNGSLLIYQRYDSEQQTLFDLIWQEDQENLYKIETLALKDRTPFGYHVDHLIRKNGKIERAEHFSTLALPTLVLPNDLMLFSLSPKFQSLSQLIKQISFVNKLSPKEAALLTHFLYKLLMPLSALIVVVGPLCWCMHFSRRSLSFLIYAIALSSYITLFTLLGASVILGENQILHPVLALCVPMGSLIVYLGYKYAKL